ncbi:MAG TPA: hypothetical protein VMI34_03980 [Candidatus Bathyarchaeia archaeon]|nr:hypothetical protein [Candidatus Bathyarchaeia archaeon]
MTWRQLALVAALTAWPLAGLAQTLDPASQAALDQTLRMLLDPQARSGELAKSPQGAAADQQIRALTGSDARTQELYEVAGEVLKDLAQSTGGDPEKMLLALDRGRTDPAAFAAMLSPATQERLRALAVKLR